MSSIVAGGSVALEEGAVGVAGVVRVVPEDEQAVARENINMVRPPR